MDDSSRKSDIERARELLTQAINYLEQAKQDKPQAASLQIHVWIEDLLDVRDELVA